MSTDTVTGSVPSVLLNRLSYISDLKGYSITAHPAYSSNLTALFLACQSLRGEESDVQFFEAFTL